MLYHLMNYTYQIFKELEEKLDLSWEDLFHHYVKDTITHKGSTHYIPCFIHWENTPSFWVNFSKKIMKCFGCGKAYGNILLFLKDYLALSPQDLIAKLAQDGFINTTEDLWEQFATWMSNDTKKQIYKFFEIPQKEAHKLMQRLMFSVGGIGYVTQEKIDEILASNKFKKKEQAPILEEVITVFKKHIGEYILMSDNYSAISFYSGEKESKAKPPYEASLDFKYVYTEDEHNHVDKLKKENMLFQSFSKQMRGSEAIDFWKAEKEQSFFTNKGFKDYLERKFWIDAKSYQESFLKMFFQNNNRVNYYIGEGFFDVYSLGILWIPSYTSWTGFEAKKAATFIRHLWKQVKRGEEYQINLCFDNDKAWIKATVKFINQYLKLLRNWIINTQQVDLNIFNFTHFETQLSRLLTILATIGAKRTTIENIFKEIEGKSEILAPYRQSEKYENLLFSSFSDIATDYNIIEKFRQKFEFNYDEEKQKKKNVLVKDFGDLPIFMFAIEVYLEKIKEAFNKSSQLSKVHQESLFEAFRNVICFSFNSIFFSSFVDIDAFKEILDRKISMSQIEKAAIDQELEAEDYFYGGSSLKNHKVNEEKAIARQLELLHWDIDVELEALYKMNFLCYDNDLPEEFLLTKEETKVIKKLVREEIKKFFPENLWKFFQNLTKQKNAIDEMQDKLSNGDSTKEADLVFDKLMQDWEKSSKKALLYFNLWKKLCGLKIEELIAKLLISEWFSETEAEKIAEWDKKYLTNDLSKLCFYMNNYYEKVREILEQNIKNWLEEHSQQGNYLTVAWYKNALYKIKRKWGEK